MSDFHSHTRRLEPPSGSSGARALPSSVDAEASVLGAVLLRNDLLHQVAGHLEEEDFYSPRHQLIFEAMREVERAGQPIDPITLEEHLTRTGALERAGGMDTLVDLTNRVPTTENVMYYVRIVRDKAVVRRLIRATTEIAAQGYGDYGEAEDFLAEAERAIFQIAQQRRVRSFRHVRPIIQKTFLLLEARGKGGGLTGVPSGFEELDKMTHGLQSGALNIIAARPSMGKTALALNIAAHAAIRESVPVLVFSLEMTQEQLVERILCSEARVEMEKLRKGILTTPEWQKITAAASEIVPSKLYIDDTPAATLQQVRSKSRQFRSDRQIFPEREEGSVEAPKGLVVIDYLQLMQAGPSGGRGMESREREISEISRGLKAMSMELEIPVIALSQLNRQVEKREDKRPNLSDLRESGAIEQDADLIAFIYRDEYYNRDKSDKKGIAEVIIGKQRNGPTGVCELAFLGPFTRFEDLARGAMPPDLAP